MCKLFYGMLGALAIAATQASAMPIQPIKVTLWDMPPANQIRGTASIMGLGSGTGFTIQVSLKVANAGPTIDLIGTGTCSKYKKLYALKPAMKGLSNTTVSNGNIIALFKSPHVVVVPQMRYCGVIKPK